MPIPKALEPTGVILADKQAGPSSFAIVARVRSRTGAKTANTTKNAKTMRTVRTNSILLWF